MNDTWQKVKLGEILKRVERFELRDDLVEYQFAGTYSFARGIFVNERKLGSSFKLPKIQRIHAGDFIYCKIMAWEGAFGLAPQEVNGCVMSGAFVAYELDHEKIDPSFLDYFFKVPANWKNIGSQSTGTNIRRQSLHPTQFEKTEIPLPPLAEQRRVVAQIEELSAQIQDARTLRQQAIGEAEALMRSIIESDPRAIHTPMRELLKQRKPDVIVNRNESYQFAGVYSFGRGVFKSALKSGADFAYPLLSRLKAGNFIYPKLMAWEGAFGVTPPECDGCVVSTEFPVFEVQEDKVFHEVLDTYFRNPAIWPQVAGGSIGTNARRRRLNPKDFLEYKFPLPSRETQIKFRAVRAQVDALKRLQAESAAELDALLPAILDRAFRGELVP